MMGLRYKVNLIKLLLLLTAIVLCLIGLWRFTSSRNFDVSKAKVQASANRIFGQSFRIHEPEFTRGVSDNSGNVIGTSLSDQKVAHLEVCVIDAQNREAIRSGRVNISTQFGPIILDKDLGQNGCAEFTVNPGRYKLNCQIPGFLSGDSNVLLQIESSSDYIRKTIKVYRPTGIRGIVKNASHQPEPDVVVICGMPVRSSSLIAPLGAPAYTNNLGEFSIDLPSIPTGIVIYASKPPHAGARVGPFDANEIWSKPIEIILPEEERAVISGQIFDSQMRPVNGATVQFHPNQTTRSEIVRSGYMNIIFKKAVKSDAAGYFSLPIATPIMGTFEVSAQGFEPYQEQITQDINESITREVLLKTPSTFSVQVHNPAGQNISGIPIMAENANIYRMGFGSDQYYVNQYPVKIFANGIMRNLGISERKLIESYQKEIFLNLGTCEIQGRVTDEKEYPIKSFNALVISVGGTENDLGLSVVGDIRYVTEDGRFTLRNLIPGTCRIRITASSDGQEIFEGRTLAIALEEGKITQSHIVLTKKPQVP